MNKEEKILKEHLPAIEENFEELKKNKMTKEIAESVSENADKILAQNFSGSKLKKMRKQLAKTMESLQSNRKGKKITNGVSKK